MSKKLKPRSKPNSVVLYLGEELIEELRKQAAAEDRSISGHVRFLLKRQLEERS